MLMRSEMAFIELGLLLLILLVVLWAFMPTIVATRSARMQTLEQLNHAYGQENHLTFVQQGELLIATLSNAFGVARVALQGAQVLDWQPTGSATPVIWTSSAAVYQQGKGVRGGVPVCWPWFGAGEAGKPAHGFVRTKLWQVTGSSVTESGVSITLSTGDDEATRALWPHRFMLSLTVMLGEDIRIDLTTHNTDTAPFTITEALHTYFGIGDVDQVSVAGLDGVYYLDKVRDMAQYQQQGDVAIVGEVDRVYVNTTADTQIVDRALSRRIVITKENSSSTVVWNPGTEKEAGFADMAQGDHRLMLCVESGTAGGDCVTVPASAQHQLRVRYALAAL